MMALPLRRLFTPRLLILELALAAVACAPLSLRRFVPDAALSLLLPVTMLGVLCAWLLIRLTVRDAWKLFLLAAVPLLLFLYIGQLGPALGDALRQTLKLLPQTLAWQRDEAPLDPSSWLLALNVLGAQAASLGARTGAWLVQSLRGLPAEDPAARAVVWSSGLWLASAWSGWQLRRHGRVLAAILPFTLLLALVLNLTGRATALLWIHLGCLLLLLGMVSFEGRLLAWKQSGRDYVDIVGMYAVFSTVLLTAILIGASYLSATTSIKDFLDRLREERQAAQASGTRPVDPVSPSVIRRNVPLGAEELLGPHPIGAGVQRPRDLVMVISTGELPRMPAAARPQPAHYYWRTMVFERYTGGGWINPPAALADVPADQPFIETAPAGYRRVRQQVSFPAGSTGRLYWTNLLAQADVPVEISRLVRTADPGPEDQFIRPDLLGAFAAVDRYSVDSYRLEPTEAQLRASPGSYPAWMVNRYISLPEDTPERVRALARRLTATAETPYDRARLIESYLRQFPYTLDVPAPPSRRDAADYFLFDLKRGYCDYYATAMVVLSRAAGLPARFVTGYASGSYDPETAAYIITEADAHSWAEIYFPGLGWVEFEPTASQPLPEREAGTAPIVSSQRAPSLRAWLDPLIAPFSRLGRVVGPLLILLFTLLFLWTPAKTALLARLSPSFALEDMYRALRRSARPLTGPFHPGQTALEFSRLLATRLSALEQRGKLARWLSPAGGELSTLTDLYNASLFTSHSPGRDEALTAARLWPRLHLRLLLARMLTLIR